MRDVVEVRWYGTCVLASGSTEAKEGRAESRADHAVRVRPGRGTVSAGRRGRGEVEEEHTHVGVRKEWPGRYQAEIS
jgi:hypothetical protein